MILLYLIYYKVREANLSQERWKEVVENLSIDIDLASQNLLLELPFPLIILKDNQNIIWYNSSFREICGVEKNILNKRISEVFQDLDISQLGTKDKKNISYQYRDKTYKVYFNDIKNTGEDNIRIMYWLDISDHEMLRKKYIHEKPVIAYIEIDNYDEVLKSSDESYMPIINAVIDRKISSWAKDINAFVIKYETDKYMLMFEYKYLASLEERRFNILDSIRETQSGNKIPITLSIGVGISRKKLTLPEIQNLSRSALDIALARGGDQAVLRKDEKIFYFGGKTQAVEKRTKVKARVKAHGLRELIENSEKVYIMGHEIPDIDCIGAALGIYRCAKFLNKEAYILFGKSNPSIDIIYSELLELGYKDAFITPENARKNATANTLLVVVDAHKRNMVQEASLIDKVDKIIVIDHHIRAAEFIEKSVLTYLEPYASSTCELVSEIIEYIDDEIKLKDFEATALLAGIYMDTKNFSIKTGVRTFEAASFLKRNGADTVKCKQLLKDDREVLIAKSEAVKNAEISENKIAIATVTNKTDKINLIVAQTADELLNIQGVEASFVIAQTEESSIISGRSYGSINVQLILEKLGGGGHMTIAGAQLPGTDLELGKKLLKKSISQYFKEGEQK
ncbi:MAG: hypothetical protein HGA49_06360 [Eubacteriaceae bacterium]|nr:hypothetical protein [Eubacteriaceae bacterium]